MRWVLFLVAVGALAFNLIWHYHSTQLFAFASHYELRSKVGLEPEVAEFEQFRDDFYRLSLTVELAYGAICLLVFFGVCGILALASVDEPTAGSGRRRWRKWGRVAAVVGWVVLIIALRVVSFPVHRHAVHAELLSILAGATGTPPEQAKWDRETSVFYNLWYGLEGFGAILSLGLAVWAFWLWKPDRSVGIHPGPHEAGGKSAAEGTSAEQPNPPPSAA